MLYIPTGKIIDNLITILKRDYDAHFRPEWNKYLGPSYSFPKLTEIFFARRSFSDGPLKKSHAFVIDCTELNAEGSGGVSSVRDYVRELKIMIGCDTSKYPNSNYERVEMLRHSLETFMAEETTAPTIATLAGDSRPTARNIHQIERSPIGLSPDNNVAVATVKFLL